MAVSVPPVLVLAALRRSKDEAAVFNGAATDKDRSEEHTSELQSLRHLVCRLLLEKKKNHTNAHNDTTKKTKIGHVTARANVLAARTHTTKTDAIRHADTAQRCTAHQEYTTRHMAT